MTSKSAPPFDPTTSLLGEDKRAIDLLSSMIEGLATHLYPSKNGYTLSLFGRYPKNTSQFCASLYTVNPSNREVREKGETRELKIGPEVGRTRCEALGKLLERVEEKSGEMQMKMSRARAG